VKEVSPLDKGDIYEKLKDTPYDDETSKLGYIK
jgi:hypothetical protein